ncbi:hypothetical protein NQ315_015444 [Exocentrus adspersus]|uniref:Metaxin n=1 Tax=Exocentrus adspersus TaxID=1586481 RepID=A0AAV8VN18_9CUCU|nr:hypothetical protein NQ315_015444 [Exocentrus adspersus]
MSQQEKFQLYVYDGDYSLPSLDVECTKSILYTAVAGVPVQVKLLNSLKHCLLYSAPTFVHKNLAFKSFGEIVLYLRTLNYNIDNKLSANQCSESLALTNLVQAKLKPVAEFAYWLDQRNCDEFTNVWFMKALPIPFNYIHTRRFRDKAVGLMETIYPVECNLEVLKEFINRMATDCLSTLSTKLGTNDYFFGVTPSTLDVIAYAYLAPLMKLPFPSTEINSIINMWPNLVNFVKRIDTDYFADLPKQPKYLKQPEKTTSSDDDVSYVAILILTVSATSLIIGFAFSRGILSSSMS